MGKTVPCPGCNQPVSVPQAATLCPASSVVADAAQSPAVQRTSAASPPPMPTQAPRSSTGSPARLAIELAPERRDISETARMSTLIGFGAWLFWAVFFSFLYAPLEGVPFERVFPLALKGGIFFGLFMAVLVPFLFVRLRDHPVFG